MASNTDTQWVKDGCLPRDLSGADLSGADLSGANLSGAVWTPIVVVPGIDHAIAAAISDGVGKLSMDGWHTCSTTHCRAGWAVVLAGQAGEELERRIGTNAAASLIYAASRPQSPVPNWFASDRGVLEELGCQK